MTFTRIWQAGGELQHINECDEDVTYGASSSTISSTKAKTGAYSYTNAPNTRGRGKAFASVSQIRAGVFVNHNSTTGVGGATRWAIIMCVKSSVDLFVGWNNSTNTLDLVSGTTVLDSIDVASAGFSTTNTWYHIGVTCFANSSTGWMSVYLDGAQILTYSGNTGTGITGCYFGGRTSSSGGQWATSAYFDDFYVDSASSETDAAPHSYRFLWSAVSGEGTSAAWTATGATPNYACVDDGVPNDDTDYVSAASSGLIDYYATANVTVPSGYVVNAVIAAAWAKKTDAGTDSEIKLGARLSGSDTTNTAQDLPTAYGPVFERHTTKPGGGSWTETDVNNAELMIESAGTF